VTDHEGAVAAVRIDITVPAFGRAFAHDIERGLAAAATDRAAVEKALLRYTSIDRETGGWASSEMD